MSGGLASAEGRAREITFPPYQTASACCPKTVKREAEVDRQEHDPVKPEACADIAYVSYATAIGTW
jgi:hypothetical protein